MTTNASKHYWHPKFLNSMSSFSVNLWITDGIWVTGTEIGIQMICSGSYMVG